jgi:hypothetical protein
MRPNKAGKQIKRKANILEEVSVLFPLEPMNNLIYCMKK